MSNTSISIKRETIGGTSLPLWLVAGGQGAPLDRVCEWASSQADAIHDAVRFSGGILLRGFDAITDAQAFDAVISRILPRQRDYIGGTSPREIVHKNIMTATYTPPDWSIILHQEMAYTRDPPAQISFFCEVPAESGGQSTVGDMRVALDNVHPAFREKCERFGLRLRRTLPSPQTRHLKPGVQKPWTEVFATEDKAQAERIANGKGWDVRWLDGETLQLWQDTVPAVRVHPNAGHAVWCNQAHFFMPVCMMTWALEDGRVADFEELARARSHHPEMLDATFFGNGEPVPEVDALHVFRLLRQLEVPLALRRSDLLILDNLTYGHGRRAFDGKRSILVCLADENMPSASHS